VSSNISGIQNFEGNDNKWLIMTIANLYEKPLASNKVFLMKRVFKMMMSKGGFFG